MLVESRHHPLESSAQQLILPRGSLRLNGRNSLQPSGVSARTMREVIAQINSPENIRGLFDQQNDHVHQVWRSDIGEELAFITPSAPRSQQSGMVVVRPRNMDHLHSLPNSVRITTFSFQMQVKYWQTLLETWKGFNRYRDESGFSLGSVRSVLTKNDCAKVSTPEEPTSQTLSIPHAMVGLLDLRTVGDPTDDSAQTDSGLAEERELIVNNMYDMDLTHLESALRRRAASMKSAIEIAVEPRIEVPPFGYEIRITNKHGTVTPAQFAALMAMNYHAYRRIAGGVDTLIDGPVPDPSFRIIATMGRREDPYSDPGDYNYRIAVSPVPISRGISSRDPMESCGMDIFRSPDYSGTVRPEQRNEINNKIAKRFLRAA